MSDFCVSESDEEIVTGTQMIGESVDMSVLTALQQPISTPTIFNIFTPLDVASQPSSVANVQHVFPHTITPQNDDNLDITMAFIKHQQNFVMLMRKCRAIPI